MFYGMSDYIQIVSEEYDLSDPYTKKKVLYCNEAQRMTNIEHLTNRLYNHIKAQTDKIDFGTIPKSKGDITRIDNYQNLIDCIDIMHKMIVQYHEKTDIIDTITTAMDNIQRRQRIFEKAFTLNIDFPMLMYNTIVLSCVSSVSLMIATCVEYVKEGKDSFTMSFDKVAYAKSKDHVLYITLNMFNKTCIDGTMDKLLNQSIKMNAVSESYIEEGITTDAIKTGWELFKAASGGKLDPDSIKPIRALASTKAGKNIIRFAAIVAAAGVLIATVRMILWAIKNVLYYLKYFSYKFSDWLTIQADFLQMNADNLQYREDRKGSEEHKAKVRDRQNRWVERMRKLANIFALKDKKAKYDADKEDKEDRKPKPYNNEDDDDSDGGLF